MALTPLPRLDMNIASKLRKPRGFLAPVGRGRATVVAPRAPVIAKTFVPPRIAAPVAAKPVDPLWGSAENTIFGMVSPLIQRLAAQRVAAEENARRVSGSHASALEQALGATAAPVAQSFDKAIGLSAAVNEVVANRLNTQGQTASSGLAAQLAQIGANAEGATQLAQTYKGASGAGFAHGAADLQHLIGRGAEAASYTAKLPQIARLEANRDLAQALSQQRQTFGEQETELLTGAQKSAFDLWNQMRGEKAEAASAKEQALVKAVADAEERAWKERQTLMALRATAVNKAQERAFDSQMKELDRKSKQEIEAANRDLAKWKVQNEPVKPSAVTGPAAQAYISVNGVQTKNPNWPHGWNADGTPKKPPKPKSDGNDNDSWLTAGSQKRQRVIDAAANRILDPDGSFQKSVVTAKNIDIEIQRRINATLKTMVPGIDLNSKAAKQFRQSAFRNLAGKIYFDKAGNKMQYAVPKWVGND